MPHRLTHAERMAQVERAFNTLPDRYLGASPGFDSTFHVRLNDLGHVWEVRCTDHSARVRKGATRRRPEVVISIESTTWLRLREGQLSGVEAFGERLLEVRGNLDHAVAFEGMFRLPNGRPPLLRIHDVPAGRHRISTLTMGSGPDVLLIHGLGGTRASFLDTAAALSAQYRVHAVDLPGFGSSSKPALGSYNASWFAKIMLDLMDELEIDRARVIGNSMGGRIAVEMGLTSPGRIQALALLCPAVAWIRRGLHPIVRLLRPEFGLLPHGFRRSLVAAQLRNLIHDRDAIDPAVADLIVDEFQRIYGSAGARFAFLASARNIYLESPYGRNGFYPRLTDLRVPSLFVWASHDPLIPAAFGRHVAKWLPTAEQVTLQDCGHVPQVERREETSALIMDFFARAAQRARPLRLADDAASEAA